MSRFVHYNSVNFGLVSRALDEIQFLNQTVHEASKKYLSDAFHNEATPLAQRAYSFIVGKKNLENNKRIRDYNNEAQGMYQKYTENDIPNIYRTANELAQKHNLNLPIQDDDSLEAAIEAARTSNNKELYNDLLSQQVDLENNKYRAQKVNELMRRHTKDVDSTRTRFEKVRNWLGERFRGMFKYGPEFSQEGKFQDRRLDLMNDIKDTYTLRIMPDKLRNAYYTGHSIIPMLQTAAPDLYAKGYNILEGLKSPFRAAVDVGGRIPKLGKAMDWVSSKTTFGPRDRVSLYDKMAPVSRRRFTDDMEEELRQDNLHAILTNYKHNLVSQLGK